MRLKNSPRSRPRLAPPVPPQRALAVVLGLSLGWAQPGHADTGADRCLKSLPRTESALQSICGPSEGLIPFRFNGRWGYLDTAGQVRIAPRFEQAQPFSGGLAAAIESHEDGAKWGYIDTAGAWAIAPRFDSADPFRSGLASVRIFSGERMTSVTSIRRGRWP